MEKILVFGGKGIIGAELIKQLNKLNYSIISASRTVHSPLYNDVQCVTNDDLFANRVKMSGVDSAVICAFSRDAACDKLAGGLEFTDRVMRYIRDVGIKNVINISSQGVYEQNSLDDFIAEDAKIGPCDCYGVAKYATELLAKNIFGGGFNFTNIRLSSVNMKQRFTYYFMECAISGKNICVNSPEQRFSLIDVSDVANGLISLLKNNHLKWENVYNLGAGYIDTIYNAACSIVNIAHNKYGFERVDIINGNSDAKLFSAVSNSKLTALTEWKPKINMQKMFEKMFENRLNM